MNVSDAGFYGGPVMWCLGDVVITVANSGAAPACTSAAFFIAERSATSAVVGTVRRGGRQFVEPRDTAPEF